MKNLIIIPFLILLSSFSAFAKKTVWVDYDLSFGKFANEVDDGFALIHALMASEELEVIGISSGFGNTNNMRHQKKWTHKVLKRMRRQDIPFYEGAYRPSDLGSETDAAKGMIKALEKGEVTFLVMGRMTNMATVVKLRPDLIKNMKEIIVNAGRMLEYPTRFGRKGMIFPDTNVDGDPEAMQVLNNHPINLTMIPTESMAHLLIKNRMLKNMWRQRGVLRWMAKIAWPWKFVWKIFLGARGFIPWDVFIVSYLTHREDFTCDENIPWEVRNMKNDTHHLFRKRNKKEYKDFLVASYDLDSKNRGTYCKHIEDNHLDNLLDFWIKRSR